jgi:ribosomal-protein-alanine N-acetyltransferase
MRLTDVDRLYEISMDSFSKPWSLNAIQEEYYNEMAYYLVARDEHEVAQGFAGAWLVFNEVQITNIAVAKDQRGKGIAEMLLRQLITEMQAKNMDLIFLEVRISNHPARKLYEKMGFVYTGKRNSFYDDNEDALLMTRFLKNQAEVKHFDPRKM